MNARKNIIEPIAKTEISITQKVEILKKPESYPYCISKVETKETHMSWVFFADQFVYKLKKPLQNHIVDFRTIKARFENSEEEIRLNRKLAKDIYIGTVPLVVNKEGQIKVEGKGKIIDWLVKMKRLSEKNMLDYRILHQKVDKSAIEETAKLLAKFYKSSHAYNISAYKFRKKLENDLCFIHSELLQSVYNFSVEKIEKINRILLNFLKSHPLVFEKRIKERKILEVHGDLRPEHICLFPQPAIIDALEFNKELRIMDVAEELSFLDMECEMMGDWETGKIFLNYYQKDNNDPIPQALILFYKAKKAFLRAYLVARHIKEPVYNKQLKWMKKANAYLQLTKKYTQLLEE